MKNLAVFLLLNLCLQISFADTFRDTFNTQSYSRNDGTHDWLTDWVESGDNGSPGSPSNSNDAGIDLIFFGLFGGELFIKDGNTGIERSADLSAYTSATLSFDYREEDFDGNGDQVELHIRTTGNWVRLTRFRGSNVGSGSYSVDISGYLSSNTSIRLKSKGGLGNDDYFYVDDFQINAGPDQVNDHISISHDGTAVSCVDESIQFTFHNSSHQTLNTYAGSFVGSAKDSMGNLVLGTWQADSVATHGAFVDNGDGTFSYNVTSADAGSFSANFSYKQEATINFDAQSGVLSEDASEDPDLIVAATLSNEGNFRDKFSGSGQNFRDNFETVSYSNNDGTLNWATNWLETDRISGGAGSGDVRITGGRLELTGNNTTNPNLIRSVAQRELDLSAFTSATLRFTMRTTSVESNDIATVAISSDGGNNWTTLGSYNDDIATWRPFSFDISSYISNNTRVRFRIEDQSGSTCCFGPSDEILQVEDIEIVTNSSAAYGNDDGSLSFINSWVESDGTGPEDGPVSIYSDALYLHGDASSIVTMERNMDLSSYTAATLSFDYEPIGNVDNDDEVEIQINSGSGWQNLTTLTGPSSGTYSSEINSYISSNTRIRFVIDEPNSSGDCCYGSSDELMKIDNFNIDVFKVSSCKSADHFSIVHSGTGVNCEAESISIIAKDSAGITLMDYEGEIDITTSSTNGDWSLITGGGSFSPTGSDAGTSTYDYSTGDAGVVILGLLNTHAETININVEDDSAITENSNSATAADDPNLTFALSGFKFIYGTGAAPTTKVIPVQISGKPFGQDFAYEPLKIRAITTDLDTGVCTGLFTGNKAIDLALECNDPSSCNGSSNSQFSINTFNLEKNNNGSVNNFTSTTLSFDANSTADLPSSLYSDAGLISLHARYLQPGDNILGSSQPITFMPAGFCTTTTETDYQCAGPNYWDCSGFKKAGEDFEITVSAQGWRSDGDADICDNNFLLSNFNGAVNVSSSLLAPSPGDAGALSASSVTLGSGSYTGNINWSEVGVLNIVAGGNTYLSNALPSNTSHEFGRFYPNDFSVSNAQSGSFMNSNSGFSYIGELDISGDGGIQYNVEPSFDFVARNVQGGTVKNYLQGSFYKNPTANINITSSVIGADGLTPLTVTSVLNDFNVTYDAVTGIYSATLNSADHFVFDRDANALVAPFNNDIQLNLTNLSDEDVPSVLSVNGLTFNPTGGEVRFGRLFIHNAYGPETNEVEQAWQTEYFDGSTFLVNTDDDNTTYDFSGVNSITVVDVGNVSDPFQSTDSTITADTGAFSQGRTTAIWSATVGQRYGTLNFIYTVQPWLTYDWSGTGFEDPNANVSFGQYRGIDKVIYWKEINY